MRLLIIGERDDCRMLAIKHAEIEWPDVTIVEHRLGRDAPLEAQFAAVGFDAAVVVAAAPSAACERTATELLTRPEFAPVVLVLLEPPPIAEPRTKPGLHRIYGRRLDHENFIKVLKLAAKEHQRVLASLRSLPNFERRYLFGDIVIRGHRCIRQVGSGGMCKIYLAESERAGSIVVLKVFNQVPDVSERIIGFDRFLQEYEIVAGLNHRNIVRIFDLGVADDHAYIAMEHFPAGDLRHRMKAQVTPPVALEYLEQIASALDAIHTVGVLHRDLKPANVMLRADGTLCLIDFGLAKANELDADLTGTREIFGTPYYMSPEQGHAELIDERSDLYSLGIVFYEMLTGRKPYTGTTAMEVIYKHKRAELPPLGPQFSAYEGLVSRLLAKAPVDRYQSARALIDDIANLRVPA